MKIMKYCYTQIISISSHPHETSILRALRLGIRPDKLIEPKIVPLSDLCDRHPLLSLLIAIIDV